ncbi:MAG TPA: DsbA family protein [Solirubrobacteraceae bacterium]|nr:DsbA family protein [Solirubrobacteraceae bacterium]
MAIQVTYFSDPGCPWAYSVNPALSVLHWRYGDQLSWQLVMIGLTETAGQYEARGYTPARIALAYRAFRRLGMPFATEPRERVPATGRACRAIVATGLVHPGREWAVFRALQIAWFTTTLLLDEDGPIEQVLSGVRGVEADRILAEIDSPQVEAAYLAGRSQARTAAGSPTAFQGKAANTDGSTRYTAPSLIFASRERRLEAGGFQPVEAYDVLIANLDPRLDRRQAAASAEDVLDRFPDGLTTQEVAAIMTAGNDPVDRNRAEQSLVELATQTRARRISAGDDAIWLPTPGSRPVTAMTTGRASSAETASASV